MHSKGTARTITDITGNTITIDPALTSTPAAGWIATFSVRTDLAAVQDQLDYADIFPSETLTGVTDKDQFDVTDVTKFELGDTGSHFGSTGFYLDSLR